VKNVITSTGSFKANATITGAGIPGGTTIAKVLSATELELSESATATANGVALTAGAPAACDNGEGSAPSPENPEADPGRLCVFIAKGVVDLGIVSKSGTATASSPGVSTSGAKLIFNGTTSGAEGGEIWGTFAVTAP
jgi:hypothetical protein